MNYLFKIMLACSLVFGFAYSSAYKPSDNKLHCKVCRGSHFEPTKKFTKFIGQNEDRILKSASFYRCSDCGAVTDIVVN
jgi:hypothetical protein